MTKEEFRRKDFREKLNLYKTEIRPFKDTVTILMISLVCLVVFLILSSNWDTDSNQVGDFT